MLRFYSFDKTLLLVLCCACCGLHGSRIDLEECSKLDEPSERGDCPCADPFLCDRVNPGPGPRQEVLGFSTHRGWWRYYDWRKITTVAVFRAWDDDALSMMCCAHSYGVRVVVVGFFDVANLTKPAIRSAWIKEQVTLAGKNCADGINIDVEQPIPQNHTTESKLLVRLVSDTRKAFRQEFGSKTQVTFDVAWSPDCVDRRCYDAKGLADNTDFLVVMSYDEQGQIFSPRPCVAGANSPWGQTLAGLVAYMTDYGIPAQKLVLGQPWYGYDYVCVAQSNDEDQGYDGRERQAAVSGGRNATSLVCHITPEHYQGAYCSDAAGRQIEYHHVMKLLRINSTTGRMWDVPSLSPHFDYVAQNGSRHQVWYDDPPSLILKYALVQKLNLLGIAIWGTDFLDYNGTQQAQAEAKEMWDVLDVTL